MFEKVRQPLRPVGRLEGHARGHRSCDEEELPLNRGRHAAGTPPDDRIEAADRLLQALHHDQHGVLALPVLRERDDLSHGAIMRPSSDTPGRFRSFEQELGVDPAIRDESCGVRQS